MAINTSKSVIDSKKTDAELSTKALNESRKLVKEKRVKFKCPVVYHELYPNGFESTYQGIHILLIFDGRTVELAECVAKYVEKKIEKKALSTLDKNARNKTKKQEYLGSYVA